LEVTANFYTYRILQLNLKTNEKIYIRIKTTIENIILIPVLFLVTLDENNNCVLTEVRKFTFRVINS
jgi:hypothetical protein